MTDTLTKSNTFIITVNILLDKSFIAVTIKQSDEREKVQWLMMMPSYAV